MNLGKHKVTKENENKICEYNLTTKEIRMIEDSLNPFKQMLYSVLGSIIGCITFVSLFYLLDLLLHINIFSGPNYFYIVTGLVIGFIAGNETYKEAVVNEYKKGKELYHILNVKENMDLLTHE